MQAARTPRQFVRALGSRLTSLVLGDQRSIIVYRTKTTVLANFTAARFGKAIETKAVLLGVDFSQQSTLQFFELHEVDLAFEYRFLYALARAFADLGNTPQPAPTLAGFGIHVVANDNQHALQRPIKGR